MMTKLRRNTKGLSPIFATLILIAIAVIAGIIVYMFTSGTLASMMGGGTAGQEKVAIQGVNPVTNVVLAQNTGGTDVTITDYIVKDAAGNVVATGAASGTTTLTVGGGLESVTCGTALSGLTGSHTVTLVTAAGGSFVSPSFVP